MTFEGWMESVNDDLRCLTGLETEDLPDMNYRMDWEDGVRPTSMVNKILKYNGYKRSDF